MNNEKIDIYEIHKWINKAKNRGLLVDHGINIEEKNAFTNIIFPNSIQTCRDVIIALARFPNHNVLLVFGEDSIGFSGHSYKTDSIKIWFCPTNHNNAARLRTLLPFTAPSSLKNAKCTFGLGDRLGIASPGHIRIISKYNVAPILAQQSVRELNLTDRNYSDSIDSASWAVLQEGYRKPWGADGDHLKTEEWVRNALVIGCTMITADVSDHIHNEYALADEKKILEDYFCINHAYRNRIEDEYLNKTYHLDTGEVISFTSEELALIALVYKDAIEFTHSLYKAGLETGKIFDFEISIDETEIPTLPQAHIFVVGELSKKGVEFVSLAPRFIGEFQKGIDYIGDTKEFERSIRTHSAIARYFSGYKISIHSGSDKFSIFPLIGRETGQQFHIKTSGTNWLEALKVLALKDPGLFRSIYTQAVEAYPITSQYYYITPDLSDMTGSKNLKDIELPSILDNPNDRRVLHIAYGELLKVEHIRNQLFRVLDEHLEQYWDNLEMHIGKHLEALQVEKKNERA